MNGSYEVKSQSIEYIFSWFSLGLFWLAVAIVGAAILFADGLEALLIAWSLPEYSHGPLIPLLSALLFLRQLKFYPVDKTQRRNRWPGVALIVLSIVLAILGKLSNISDLVAYGIIVWIGGILLVSFGWNTGRHFWPPVLHLVYMLPLPGVIYYKMSTWLQFISSELGVIFLGFLSVPVFLEGNIIDLGVTKLHVAEACSGLRYLFPILSFSYIFAVLYKGPIWHKAVLLLAACPITVLMNSVRIAISGLIVQHWGVGWLDGFTHFFEGWVIFVICIMILFAIARLLLFFNREKLGLVEGLDLDFDGIGHQAARIRFTQASRAMVLSATLMVVVNVGWHVAPKPDVGEITRVSFEDFPQLLGDWRQEGAVRTLSPAVARVLAADDYHSVNFVKPGSPSVEFFSAWYQDQSRGGVHSPEICLPGAGWEIAWLERVDLQEEMAWKTRLRINRGIIQKGETRMMVFYWFDQGGRKVAWDLAAKYWLLIDGISRGKTDGAIVRLTTPILDSETEEDAEARLMNVMREVLAPLKRHIPS